MNPVLALDDVTAADRIRVGGKAWNLARLVQRGLPVPAAVVLTKDAFAAALSAAGLSADATAVQRDPALAGALAAHIVALPPPPALMDALARALRAVPGPYAVRSSAPDEDGTTRSFAGQHETVLGATDATLWRAITRCWASLYGEGAMAYRSNRGPAPGAMAVVVQHLVSPLTSGVLFTINPLSGSWREMTVEATWGLCEPLVSGTIAPHWTLVRRPRRIMQRKLRPLAGHAPNDRFSRALRRAIANARLSILQQDLPELATRSVVAADGAVITEEVPEELRARPTLSRDQLLDVCRVGLRAESLLGAPQDVEWAIGHQGGLFVLQSRPITRAAPTEHARDEILWTRRFIGERWTEPATPLGWSLISPVLEHFIAYPKTQARYLGGESALKLVASRPFVNVTAFRHLAFKLPGAPAPRFMLELIPADEESAWQRRFAVAPDLSVYASFLRETAQERRWRRFRYNPLTNPDQWDAFADRLKGALPDLTRAPVSARDAIQQVDVHQEWVTEYVGIHLCSLLFANLAYDLLERALTAWLPEHAAALMTALAACPPGNHTLDTNAALARLAGGVKPRDLTALAAGAPLSPPFQRSLDAFLARYGHRSAASWELFTPRWADDPATLAPLLRSLSTPEDPTRADPSQAAPDHRDAHMQAIATVRQHLGGPKRMILEGLTAYTRRYLLLRENQRFLFDRLLASEKHTLTWMGRRLVDRGTLAQADDVAFLTWPELRALTLGELEDAPVRTWVKRRKNTRTADANQTPPVFLRGGDEAAITPTGARLQGLGISPGRVRGRVLVVTHLKDVSAVPEGAVLVAHAVDPGWTPLFGKAAALVLELGSRLSHGAVVAREYGLPAVVNLEGVTRHLKDGQEVTVDGTRGIVWVHA